MGTTPRARRHVFGVSGRSDTVSSALRTQNLGVPLRDSRWYQLREREEQTAKCTSRPAHRRFVSPAREPVTARARDRFCT